MLYEHQKHCLLKKNGGFKNLGAAPYKSIYSLMTEDPESIPGIYILMIGDSEIIPGMY